MTITVPALLAWALSLLLISGLLSGTDRDRRVLWAGLTAPVILIVALAFGEAAALVVALLSAPLAFVIQRAQASAPDFNAALRQISFYWLMLLPGILGALLILRLLSISLPVEMLDAGTLLTLLIAVLVGLVVRLASWHWLLPPEAQDTFVLGYSPQLLAADSALTIVLPLAALALSREFGWLLVCGLAVVALYLHRSAEDALAQKKLQAEIAELKQLLHGAQTLQAASRQILESLEKEQALEIALETATSLSPADGAAIFLVEPDQSSLKLARASGSAAQYAPQWPQLPYTASVNPPPFRLIRPGDAPDAETPELAVGGPYATLTELGLHLANRALGVLRLYFAQDHTPNEAERSLLGQLASNTANLYETLDWFAVMENYAFEMAQLTHLAHISTSNLSMDSVLQDMIRVLRQMANMSKVTLALAHTQVGTGEPQPLDLYGDVANSGTLILDSVPELAQMRQPEYQRLRHFKRTDIGLSEPMQALIGDHGELLSVIPLLSHYDLLGLILLSDSNSVRLSDHQWQVLEMASNQVAWHILDTRLFVLTQEALSARMEQLSILSTIAQQISSALDPDTIVSTMLEMAVRSTEANRGTVSLLLEDEEVWKVFQFQQDGTLQRSRRAQTRDEGVIGQVVRTKETLTIPDTRQVSAYLTGSSPAIYLSAVAVPLISEGRVIGVLHMESVRPDFFAKEQTSFLTNLARHAVISIENARLLAERQRQIVILQELQNLSIKLSSVTETRVVANQVLLTALELLDGSAAILFRIVDNEGKRRLDILAEHTHHPQGVQLNGLFRTTSHALRAAQTGETQIVQDLHSLDKDNHQSFKALFVPIMRGERPREILCLGFDGKRTLGKRELDIVALLASQAGGHLENATLHEYIHSGNDRMHAILNSTRDGVILVDKSGRLVEVNPSAQRLLGINLEDHIGQSLVEALLQYAGTDEFPNAGYSHEEVTVLARQLRLEPERISRRQFSRTGPKQTTYIEEIGSPVIDSEGQISGRLLVLRDVTEQKQLADYRDEITHMAVHDLRGPLASIISSLSFTLDDPEIVSDEPTLRKTLGFSLESANNLLRLVESLLDIARLEKRQMPLKLASTSIELLVSETVVALTSSMQSANVTLVQEIGSDIHPLNVDHDVIRRVLINLVDNALRFTPADSKILIEATHHVDHILIRIADSGTGIPPEERERIFERFRQIKANQPLRGSRGAGLGLTFCKLAVEAHGGRIWVDDNSPLPGACFAITLPYRPPVR
ncbi:MAG: GAF domain-containing protein [Anaerolineae bacterium]|nr:GAF domain-containing protein [Anaerolineae bacterium]